MIKIRTGLSVCQHTSNYELSIYIQLSVHNKFTNRDIVTAQFTEIEATKGARSRARAPANSRRRAAAIRSDTEASVPPLGLRGDRCSSSELIGTCCTTRPRRSYLRK